MLYWMKRLPGMVSSSGTSFLAENESRFGKKSTKSREKGAPFPPPLVFSRVPRNLERSACLLTGEHSIDIVVRVLSDRNMEYSETSRKRSLLMSGLGGRSREVVAYGKFHE